MASSDSQVSSDPIDTVCVYLQCAYLQCAYLVTGRFVAPSSAGQELRGYSECALQTFPEGVVVGGKIAHLPQDFGEAPSVRGGK